MGGRGSYALRNKLARLVAGGGAGGGAMMSKPSGGAGGGGEVSEEEAGTGIHHEFNAMYRGLKNKLTPAERGAIKNYTGQKFNDVNAVMRGDKAKTAEMGPQREAEAKAQAKLLKNVFKEPLTRNVTTFRGTNIDDDAMFAQMSTPNAVWQDKAFVSTSLASSKAKEFVKMGQKNPVVFKIINGKGQKAAYVDAVTGKPWEYELLLPAGTKFRTVSVRKNKAQIGGETATEILVRVV